MEFKEKTLGCSQELREWAEADKASAIGSTAAAGGLMAGSLDPATSLGTLLVPGLGIPVLHLPNCISERRGPGELLRECPSASGRARCRPGGLRQGHAESAPGGEAASRPPGPGLLLLGAPRSGGENSSKSAGVPTPSWASVAPSVLKCREPAESAVRSGCGCGDHCKSTNATHGCARGNLGLAGLRPVRTSALRSPCWSRPVLGPVGPQQTRQVGDPTFLSGTTSVLVAG